jgi:hypothetical protein
MLVEELRTYAEVSNAYNSLEQLYEANLKREIEIKGEIQAIVESPQASYGFFGRTTKEDKIAEKNKEVVDIATQIFVQGQLLSLISDQFVEYEIEQIRQHKRERFDKIINQFSESKIEQLERELTFWRLVKEQSAFGNSENLDSKIEKGHVRISKLD